MSLKSELETSRPIHCKLEYKLEYIELRIIIFSIPSKLHAYWSKGSKALILTANFHIGKIKQDTYLSKFSFWHVHSSVSILA